MDGVFVYDGALTQLSNSIFGEIDAALEEVGPFRREIAGPPDQERSRPDRWSGRAVLKI
jgi:hypothetical protein